MAYITVRDLSLGYDAHSIVEGLDLTVWQEPCALQGRYCSWTNRSPVWIRR